MSRSTLSIWGSLAKQTLGMAAVAMLLTINAHAGTTCLGTLPGICASNGSDTTTAGSGLAGISLTAPGAPITLITGSGGGSLSGSNLGSITFSTGSFITGSGSLGAGGQFNPGTLTITLTSSYYGFTGTLFTGTFGGNGVNISWINEGTNTAGYYQYELTGPIYGTAFNGSVNVSGETAQLFFTTTKKAEYNGGVIDLSSGNSNFVTPEPAALGLMGTGLVGIGLAARRKAKARFTRRGKASAARHADRASVPSAVQAQAATV